MSKSGAHPTALVVGRGADGARAALDLAAAGARVTLLTPDHGLAPGAAGPTVMPLLLDAARHPGITLLVGAEVQSIGRNGNSLEVAVTEEPRYVDEELCTACGRCAEICPVLVPSDGDGQPALHTAIYRGGVPTIYAIDKLGTSPCRDACPIHQRAQGYTALIRAGDFEAAYRTIKRDNPFPSVCGRICNHRCEDACSRCQVDSAVSLMALKRFATDWAREHGVAAGVTAGRPGGTRPEPTGKRVAVVGSGPAGLTCALDLVRKGHAVTVYEALPAPGGMMRVGVPDYRLPQEIVQEEIDDILAEGVELVLNHRVEDVPGLLDDGFDAVFVAVGAHGGVKLPIPGSDLPGVLLATEFLRAVSLGRSAVGDRAAPHAGGNGARSGRRSRRAADNGPEASIAGRRVLVIGGGNVAIDAAMTAVRLGASWVGMSCLESRETMPAHDWEVRDAKDEGIEVFPSRTFKEIVAHDDGTVAGVRCVQVDFRGFVDMRPDFDEIADTEETIAADTVIWAIGQRPEIDCLGDHVELEHGRFVAVDETTLATNVPGLFAGGDVVTGTTFVVDAIAAGRRAAESIDSYLRDAAIARVPDLLPAVELSAEEVRTRAASERVAEADRAPERKRPAAQRKNDFAEVSGGLTVEEAQLEAQRCLSCGFCSECLQCVDACPADAIDHSRQPRRLKLSPSAAIWADGTPTSSAAPPAGELPGFFMVGNGTDLAPVVDQVLSHLGLTSTPGDASLMAAPSRWPFEPGAAAGGGLGVFLCRCGGEITRTVDLDAVGQRLAQLSGVTHVQQVDFACHPEGHEEIRSACADRGLSNSVLAACSCCALDQICFSCTTQRTRCKDRLGVFDALQGYPMEFVNFREQCAFVHRSDPAAATAKAGDLVAAAVASLLVSTGASHAQLAGRFGADLPGATNGRGPHAPHEGGPRLPIAAFVDPFRCRGCEDCEKACGLDAVHVVGSDGTRLARVDAALCAGCGVCMSACPSGAITASDASDAQVLARLAAMGDLGGKTVVFSCNWGAYSAVEAAGVDRLDYDPSVRLVRLMCAGRAHVGLILRAFARGAERVLMLTCGQEGDQAPCHYDTGAGLAHHSVEQARGMLSMLGIDPNRLACAQMQPGNAELFVAAVEKCTLATPEAAG